MQIVRQFVEAKGDEVGLSDESGTYTWTQVNDRGNRLIHALRGMGLSVGDRLAILSNNRHEFIEVSAASAHAGLVLVPVNWHLVAPEIAYILADSGAKALITELEFLETAADAAHRAGGIDVKIVFSPPGGASAGADVDGFADYESLLDGASSDEPPDQSAGATMFYTSGTTGNPKGVISTALNPGQDLDAALATIQGLGGMLGVDPRETLINSPLYHAGPFAAAMVVATSGGPLVLRRKFDPVESLELIQDEKVEQAYFVPTHFVRFLKMDEATRSSFDLSSLKNVFHTGAPCPVDVKKAIIDWWGPVMSEYYGASEAPGSGASVSSEEWLKKPCTVGKALPTCEIHILGDDGNELSTGEIGEVWFKSLLGIDFEYAGAPEKTKEVHKGPGFYTYGDVGYLDEDGYLFLSDRQIDMIVSGGANIYPAEIEAVLINHRDVADVAVFGVPNDEFGEEVKAAIHLLPGREPTAELQTDLRTFATENLAKFKVPRSFDFHDEFPRTPTGKLHKRLLRDPYWEGKERAI